VHWTSLEDIARGNAGVRRVGSAVSLRPYSHTVRIPDGAESLTVAAPDGDQAVDGWSFAGQQLIHPFGNQVDVPEGATQLRLRVRLERDPTEVSAPRRRVWPRLRRIATESRDRLVAVRP
jgi:hypothetical protein